MAATRNRRPPHALRLAWFTECLSKPFSDDGVESAIHRCSTPQQSENALTRRNGETEATRSGSFLAFPKLKTGFRASLDFVLIIRCSPYISVPSSLRVGFSLVLENSTHFLRAPLEDLSSPRPFPERLQLDLVGVLQVLEEDLIHLLPHTRIERNDLRLIVERDRPVVEVHRSDGRPEPVDHDRLRMHHRRFVFVDLHSSLEKPFIQTTSRIQGALDVGLFTHRENAHVHSALRLIDEQSAEVVIRHEVRVRYVKTLSRSG